MPKFVRRPEHRPAEILDAALRHFVAEGFAAARMDAIAAEAGVTAGTIYRYFPSKEGLVEALVEHHLDPSWARGREIAEAYGSMTARQILDLLLHRWADHLDQPAAASLLVLMLRESPRFPELARRYVDRVVSVGCLAIERALRHGIDRGEFPLLEIGATARALASVVVGDAIWRASFGPHLPSPASREAAGRPAIDAVVRGLPRRGEAATTAAPAAPARTAPPESPAESGLRIVTLRRPDPER